MKLALGIDFSTKALHCAYGEVGDLRPRLVKVPVEGAGAEEWIGHIHDRLGALLDALEDLGEIEVSLMVIERPFYSSNPRTTLKLAQVQSAAIGACHIRKWVSSEQDPSTIRKEILGFGTSRVKGEIKTKAMEYVYQTYGQHFDSDESDAVIIWEYACRILQQSS